LRELTDVVIKDFVPDEFKLIKGSKSIKISQLNAEETVNLSYALKPLKIGEYKLPPAVVFYKAPPPLTGEVSKKSKSVYVRVVKVLTPTPSTPSTPKVSGFGAVITIYTLVVTLVYLGKRDESLCAPRLGLINI